MMASTNAESASNNNNPQAGQGRPLSKKEGDLFRNVVKHYECKQYKKAMKGADTILKKFPNHGETLAMKGLVLNSWMAKRDESHALVKQGLMHDMRSHVCWHVYGLLHRADRNYNEAIKAYKQALRIDPENLQILRDLSLLQIQMRDLDGFCVTRNTLLTLKPNAKVNWLSLALAKHLTGDLQGAINVIDIYLGTLTEGHPELSRCFESSELALYRNSILAEVPGDDYKEALNHLATCESVVVDRGAWLMMKATYQLKRGDFAEAKETCLTMFARGLTEDYRVHSIFMCAVLQLKDNNESKICEDALKLTGTNTLASMVVLPPDQRQLLKELYLNDVSVRYPSSPAIHRIPLTLMEGDELRSALDAYCRRGLLKGVPSLCSEMSSLLFKEVDGRFHLATDPVDIKDHATYKMLVELADEYIATLSQYNKFSPNGEDADEDPTTILWAWYLRAGYHGLAGEKTEGIVLLDKCLDHTPTAVDVYEMKALLLKSAGDLNAAVECLDKGRELDKQDRYINNQTTKYMLQAGMEEKALQRISLFTRHEGNPEQNLFDMQCSWYELELAECLERKGDWGRSLKKFYAVVQHFEDFNEDQFDFHAYCIRKVTLRAYVDVLRFEDELLGEEYYGRAASGIIRIFLHLYDKPPDADEDEEPDYSNMNAAEKKKAKAVARKKKKAAEKKAAEDAERRKKLEEESAANLSAENGSKKKGVNKTGKIAVADADPEGLEFLKRDPLEEASKLAATLAMQAPKRFSTWMMQYDVAIRRKKGLLALQALFKARALDPSNPDILTRIVDFASRVDTLCNADLAPAVRKVLTEETHRLLNGQSINEFVANAASQVAVNPSSSLPTRVAVAKALVATKTASIADACGVILDGGLNVPAASVETCNSAFETLVAFGNEAKSAQEKFEQLVREKFPIIKSLVQEEDGGL